MVRINDPVTSADIARRVGMTPQAVRALSRSPSWPRSPCKIGRSDVWAWREVAGWFDGYYLSGRGKPAHRAKWLQDRGLLGLRQPAKT